jgi:cation:H+ antiporter
MSYLLIAGGLVLLFLGGEALVRGSVGVARRLGLSELVIGLTLVGFGTSVPELVTSLRAVSQDAVGMSVGNVAGSNIANILLVLGVAALISPIITHPRALARDFSVMVGVTLLFGWLVYMDLFTRPIGIGLVVLLVGYMIGSLLLDRAQGSDGETAVMHTEEGELIETPDPLPIAALLAIGGIAGVVIGARMLVTGGIDIAAQFGVSETLVGLTIVAFGTSLPELATAAISALRGKSDVALGTVLGSNIFNILGIIGVTAIVHPFSLYEGGPGLAGKGFDIGEAIIGATNNIGLTWTDISTLILSIFLVFLFAFTGKRIARSEGAIMLAGYLIYMGFLFQIVPTPFAS